jgi:uncharacterized protein YijF (DUF1287 family)
VKKLPVKRISSVILGLVIISALLFRYYGDSRAKTSRFTESWLKNYQPSLNDVAANITDFYSRLAEAAEHRATQNVKYDGSYISIGYPGGDVPSSIGVCSDEVIRSYRVLGIDLQKDLHEDMVVAFSEYPSIWRLSDHHLESHYVRVSIVLMVISKLF